jgi:hypothetical protein
MELPFSPPTHGNGPEAENRHKNLALQGKVGQSPGPAVQLAQAASFARAAGSLLDRLCERPGRRNEIKFRPPALSLADPVPDANTIWIFREALTRAQITGEPAI